MNLEMLHHSNTTTETKYIINIMGDSLCYFMYRIKGGVPAKMPWGDPSREPWKGWEYLEV